MKKPYDISGMPEYLRVAVRQSVLDFYNKTTDMKYKNYIGSILRVVDCEEGNMEITANQYHAILQAMAGPGAQVFNEFVMHKKKLSVFKGLGT